MDVSERNWKTARVIEGEHYVHVDEANHVADYLNDIADGWAARLAHHQRGAVDPCRELLATFVDDEPCRFDHHGYCQAHGWLDEGECNVARARRLLATDRGAVGDE